MERAFFDWTSLRKAGGGKSCKGAETDRSDYPFDGEMDPKESPFEAVQSFDQKGN